MDGSLAGMRVTVMGLGRFGGGAGVARWLAERGARVVVTDMEGEEALAASIEPLRDWIARGVIELRLGGHDVRDFAGTECVIANPAVRLPWSNELLLAARRAGAAVTTEIRLVTERLNRLRVIGVTGSAGKSTTSAMIHHVLRECGVRSHLGGNIGGSLLSSMEEIGETDWVVLELSSAMLWWLGEEAGAWDTRGGAARGGWSPRVAVLTNIEPNHVDWHGSMEHYVACKGNVFRYQASVDTAIAGPGVAEGRFGAVIGDSGGAARTALTPGPSPKGRGEQATPPPPPLVLRVPGRHNQMNARVAIEAARLAAGISELDARHAIASFAGLPHRLQLVTERDGMRFFNDSKSTTPGATMLAVESFEDASRVHLIAGGYDKGVDLSAIAGLARRLGGLYTIGQTGERLRETASDGGGSVVGCGALERAVECAMARMRGGDVLLLSPGCASWDQFESFERRGERFEALLREWLGEARDVAQRGGVIVESKAARAHTGETPVPLSAKRSRGRRVR